MTYTKLHSITLDVAQTIFDYQQQQQQYNSYKSE